MFTGLVEDTGEIKSVRSSENGLRFKVQTRLPLEDIQQGDSIAIDGVCLTVTGIDNALYFDVSPETLKRSTLGSKKTGEQVNLERALQLSDRLGGHLVTGHIDGMGKLKSYRQQGEFVEINFTAPENILKYIIEKGSVAIDGISLTVNSCSKNTFSVMIIPHTLDNTTLKSKKIGDMVNIENDIIGKYVEKLLPGNLNQKNRITGDFLERFNFK